MRLTRIFTGFLVLVCLLEGEIAAALSQAEIDECLQCHNEYRRRHENTGDLAWSNEIQAYAQTWADYLATINRLQHDPEIYSVQNVGENLFGGWGSHSVPAFSCQNSCDSWYEEIKDWDFDTNARKASSPSSAMVGHFTQMVWKASTLLGVGIATNPANNAIFIVAKYRSIGNYGGQYGANVCPLIATTASPAVTTTTTTTTAEATTQPATNPATETTALVTTTTGPTTTAGPTTTTAAPTTTTTAPPTTTTTAPPTTTTTTEEYVPPPLSKEKQSVECHNSRRMLHQDTPDLGWDTELEELAQAWADVIAARGTMEHDPKNDADQTGENIYWASGGTRTVEDACKAWYDEIDDYDFKTHGKKASSPSNKMIGHFTQMVWKSTTKIGVGIAYKGSEIYIVAKYRARGNFIGRYAENVMPKTSENGQVLDKDPPPKTESQSPAGETTSFEVRPPTFVFTIRFTFRYVFVMIRIFPSGSTTGARKPNAYSLSDCARGVDSIRIIFKFRRPSDYQSPCRCGRRSTSSRKRRSIDYENNDDDDEDDNDVEENDSFSIPNQYLLDQQGFPQFALPETSEDAVHFRHRRNTDDTIDPDSIVPSNPELPPGSTHAIFYMGQINDGASIVSDWYDPVTTQVSADETYCTAQKSCACDAIATGPLNATIDINNATYAGLNDSAVNTSILAIGNYDQQTIINTCKEAKCDSTALSTTISGIESSINQTQSDIQTINDAKKNLRLAIDCRVNSDNRDEIFDHYQSLFTREAYISNVMEDLKIKKEILEKEKKRCENRSWLRQVLENVWHKG
ncbi:uncharacterized protein [Clytia hemisphaerica]